MGNERDIEGVERGESEELEVREKRGRRVREQTCRE